MANSTHEKPSKSAVFCAGRPGGPSMLRAKLCKILPILDPGGSPPIEAGCPRPAGERVRQPPAAPRVVPGLGSGATERRSTAPIQQGRHVDRRRDRETGAAFG